MLRLIGVRIASGLATLFVASILIFGVMQLLPGDAVTAFLGQSAASPEVVAELRHEYGLDRPLPTRYVDWIAGAVHGDFGKVGASGQSVSVLIGTPIRNSLILVAVALVIVFPLGLLVGTASALRRDSWLDGGLQGTVLLFSSLPSFVIGITLILLFSFRWHLLPAVTFTVTPLGLILPVATLALAWTPFTARMVRTGVVDVLESDYVQLARLKGIPEGRVVRSHVLPNSLVPAIQAFALCAASMPAGIVVVEFLFAFQGIGNTLVQSVENRDTATVTAIMLILVSFYVIANLISDIATVLLTPRLRTDAGLQ